MRAQAVVVAVLATTVTLAQGVSAETAAPSETEQALGIFAQTCLQFAGQPEQVRAYLKSKGAQEFSPNVRSLFLQDHVGIVYNVSTPSARLAVVSEDNGVCSSFMGSGDAINLASELHLRLRNSHIPFNHISDDELSNGKSSSDHLHLGTKDYSLVTSVNGKASGPIRAVITLAPKSP